MFKFLSIILYLRVPTQVPALQKSGVVVSSPSSQPVKSANGVVPHSGDPGLESLSHTGSTQGLASSSGQLEEPKTPKCSTNAIQGSILLFLFQFRVGVPLRTRAHLH